jgi:orotate phosphoribosyltransferase
MAPRGQLIEDIKKAALLHGEFTLRSGKKSNYYLDKYLFGTDPKILEALVPYIIEKLPPAESYDRLAGPELGAITLTTAVALKTGKPFVLVRKQLRKSHEKQN